MRHALKRSDDTHLANRKRGKENLYDAACFWSVNVYMHVFRQSRAVLRIVTLHALLLPPPHLLLPPPLDFIPFPNVCCALLLLSSPVLSLLSLFPSCLFSAILQFVGYSSPNSSNTSTVCVSQQLLCFKGRQGHPLCVTLLCPLGLLSSHVLFILQVTTLCRWSISSSRGSWDTTLYRRISPLSWLLFCHKSLSGSTRSLSLLAQLLVYALSPPNNVY